MQVRPPRKHRSRVALAAWVLAAALALAGSVTGCSVDLTPPSWRGAAALPSAPTSSTVELPAPRTAGSAGTRRKATTVPLETVVPATHTSSALRARLRNAAPSGFKVVSKRITTDTVSVTQSFRFEGKRRTVSFTAPRRDLRWSDGRVLEVSVTPGESHAAELLRFWRSVTLEPHQTTLYDSLASSLRKIRSSAKLGPNEYAELITAYVQQMPYDTAQAESGADNRYPVVTAVKGTGVCGDKSMLLAGLLAHEGYRVALLEFEPEAHMAVGVKVAGPGFKSSGYTFVETTGPGLVGEIGIAYGPGGTIRLRSRPMVIPISTAGTWYTADGQVTWILGRVNAFERVYDESAARVQSDRATLDRYDAAAVTRFNDMVDRVNRAANTINMVHNHTDDREALAAYLQARGEP